MLNEGQLKIETAGLGEWVPKPGSIRFNLTAIQRVMGDRQKDVHFN